MKQNDKPENDLAVLAGGGDSRAIAALYEQTYSKVYYTIKSMIKDEDAVFDILQDSYIKAFSSLESITGEESFLPWVRAIAANTARDWLRKKRPMLFSDLGAGEDADMPVEEMFEDSCTDHVPELVIDQNETKRLIREIIEGLPEDQRAAVGMYYYEEMSVKEIASEMGATENAVKSRLLYARRKIEAKVRELEKAGTKLYSLAPLPFLLMLFGNQKEAASEIPDPAILQNILGGATVGGLGAAAPAAISAGSKATAVSAKTAAASAKAAGLGAAKITAIAVASAAVIGSGIYGVTKLADKPVPIDSGFIREDNNSGYSFTDTFEDESGVTICTQHYDLGGNLRQETKEVLDDLGRVTEKHDLFYLDHEHVHLHEDLISYVYTPDDRAVSVRWQQARYTDAGWYSGGAQFSYTMQDPDDNIEFRLGYERDDPEDHYIHLYDYFIAEYRNDDKETAKGKKWVTSGQYTTDEAELIPGIPLSESDLPVSGPYVKRIDLVNGEYVILDHDDTGRLIHRTRYQAAGSMVTDYSCLYDDVGREAEIFCSKYLPDGTRLDSRTSYIYMPGDLQAAIRWDAALFDDRGQMTHSGGHEFSCMIYSPESHVRFSAGHSAIRKAGKELGLMNFRLLENCPAAAFDPAQQPEPYTRRIDNDNINYTIKVYDSDSFLELQTILYTNAKKVTSDRTGRYDGNRRLSEEHHIDYLDLTKISDEHISYLYTDDGNEVTVHWEMTDYTDNDPHSASEDIRYVMKLPTNQIRLIRNEVPGRKKSGKLELGDYQIQESGLTGVSMAETENIPADNSMPVPETPVQTETPAVPETPAETEPQTPAETEPETTRSETEEHNEEKGSNALSAAEEWAQKELSSGRIVLTGTIDTYDYYETVDLQGMPDANPGVTDRSKTYRIIIIDEEQTLSGSQDIWSGSRRVSMIYVPDAGIPSGYDGSHIVFSIRDGSLNWPSGTDMPLGIPRCKDVHVME